MGDFAINATLQNQSLTQVKGDELMQSLRNHTTLDKSAKIDKAARDFESILVGQWLEQAEKSFATMPGMDPDEKSDSAHGHFQSIACQSLAEGLSQRGGFGIAAMISKQLKAVETTSEEAASRGNTDGEGSIGKSHNSK
jgi:Rod binding domain-containing protein